MSIPSSIHSLCFFSDQSGAFSDGKRDEKSIESFARFLDSTLDFLPKYSSPSVLILISQAVLLLPKYFHCKKNLCPRRFFLIFFSAQRKTMHPKNSMRDNPNLSIEMVQRILHFRFFFWQFHYGSFRIIEFRFSLESMAFNHSCNPKQIITKKVFHSVQIGCFIVPLCGDFSS